MKKIFALLIISLLAVFLISGCIGKDTTNGSDQNSISTDDLGPVADDGLEHEGEEPGPVADDEIDYESVPPGPVA